MDTASLDLYFHKLDETVYDEEKIITWNSIANSLKLPISEIPELLSNYLSDRRKLKPNDFAVTYCVAGILKADQQFDICCVDEANLEQKRERFEKIVKQQVYSIQKSKSIDFNAISLVDQVETFPNNQLPGSIVSKNCVKRNIKKKNLPTVQTKPTNSGVGNAKQFEKKQEQKNLSSQTKAQTVKGKNNGGIANFFNKAPVKTNSQKTENTKPKAEDCSEGKENKATQPTAISNNSVEDAREDKMDVKEEKMEVEESKNDKDQSNKKRKKTQKNDGAPNKKRKRIQVINDSDSSDIFSEPEEDIVEKSDDEPEPPPKPQVPSKHKVRKAVDKTFMDEEGFIVTKTEYVFESVSEDEKEAVTVVKNEPKLKVLEKKNSTTDSENDTKSTKGQKKNKKPVSGKQPTLMNFFKKI